MRWQFAIMFPNSPMHTDLPVYSCSNVLSRFGALCSKGLVQTSFFVTKPSRGANKGFGRPLPAETRRVTKLAEFRFVHNGQLGLQQQLAGDGVLLKATMGILSESQRENAVNERRDATFGQLGENLY